MEFTFPDESEAWSAVFLAAITGTAAGYNEATLVVKGQQGPVASAERIANLAVDLLAKRAKAREEKVAEERKAEAERRQHAAERVREVGAYVDTEGRLYEVGYVGRDDATLTERRPMGHVRRVKLLSLVDPDWLAKEEGLHAAPEKARRSLLAQLKIAAFFGLAPDDVKLTWDGDEENVGDEHIEPRILDVQIRGCRPRRATWTKLVDAGLPIYPYDAAMLSCPAEER